MDWKLELVAIPVSDVDRAKSFYVDRVGFVADHDHTVSEEIRFVQLTPPGSACSIAFGKGVTEAEPGSVQGLQIVVSDIEAAHAQLTERGVEVGDVQDFPWGRFVFFADPDGNRWAVQQLLCARTGAERSSAKAPPRRSECERRDDHEARLRARRAHRSRSSPAAQAEPVPRGCDRDGRVDLRRRHASADERLARASPPDRHARARLRVLRAGGADGARPACRRSARA